MSTRTQSPFDMIVLRSHNQLFTITSKPVIIINYNVPKVLEIKINYIFEVILTSLVIIWIKLLFGKPVLSIAPVSIIYIS